MKKQDRRDQLMSELNVTGKMARVITGISLRTAQQHLLDLRIELGKYKGQCVSLIEFCKNKDIKVEYAIHRLKKFGLL